MFVAALVSVVTAWMPVITFDHAVAASARRAGDTIPGWTALWVAVSTALGPTALRIVAVVVVAGWAIAASLRRGTARRARWRVPYGAATVLVGGILPVAIKAVVSRPRPPDALVGAVQSSFPSAHAFAAVVAAGVVVLAVAGRRGGVAIGFSVCALALVVCVARVALAVHYVSDVVAGAALGAVWVAASALVWRAVSAGAGGRERSR